jgi:hypothetical protein
MSVLMQLRIAAEVRHSMGVSYLKPNNKCPHNPCQMLHCHSTFSNECIFPDIFTKAINSAHSSALQLRKAVKDVCTWNHFII